MTTKAEQRSIDNGIQLGKILANQDNLHDNVDKGFKAGTKRFDALEEEVKSIKTIKCEPNTEKLNVLYTQYEEDKEFKKEMKKTIFKTSLKIIIPTIMGIFGFGGIVFAFFKQGMSI